MRGRTIRGKRGGREKGRGADIYRQTHTGREAGCLGCIRQPAMEGKIPRGLYFSRTRSAEQKRGIERAGRIRTTGGSGM